MKLLPRLPELEPRRECGEWMSGLLMSGLLIGEWGTEATRSGSGSPRIGSRLARRRSCGRGGRGGTGGASIDILPSMEGEKAGSLPRLEDRRESDVTDVGTEASRDGGRPPQ